MITVTDTPQGAHLLGTEPIGRLLRHYALPAIVGSVVNVLYNVVDRIFIAQGVSSIALSGLAVTLPVMTFVQAFSILIGAGAATRISILLGQKKRDEAENLLGNAFLLSILSSILVVVGCMVFIRPLLLNFGASAESLPYALDYLSIVLPGNIFANITYSYNAVMRSTGYPKKAMYTMMIGAVINFVLDPLFIFVLGWGIRGAAVATVISMVVGMVWVLRHFLSKDSLLQIRTKYFRLQRQYVLGIISIGISPFMIQILASLVIVIKNTSLYRYGQLSPITEFSGDQAVASLGIVNSIAMLILMVTFGISQGIQPIIGYNYGAGNYERVKKTFKLAVIVNVSLGLIGSLLAFFAPTLLARVFTQDPHLIKVSATAISIEIIAMWAVGFQITSVQFFQSIGKAWRAMVLSFSRQAIFLIPLLLVLPSAFGVMGVWMAPPIADVLSASLSIIFVTLYFRREEK